MLAAALAVVSCTTAPTSTNGNQDTLRPRSNPVEFVGMTFEMPITSEADFMAIVDPIFGAAAQGGTFHTEREVHSGVFLTTMADSRTPTQAIVTLSMNPPADAHHVMRTILQVPVSFEYGAVYIDAVRAALATSASVVAAGDTMEPWHLEYHVASPHGGDLVLQTELANGHTVLRFRTAAPQTSLAPGMVNTPAFTGDPYETLSGTVFFELDRDEFSFFTNRAYGISSGALQNFHDFQLHPHTWLRLTVTPQLENADVNVAFDVITVDGRRVPFAQAPASIVAGEQFQENVFSLVDSMNAAEAAAPGSSTPWEAPFYYDDPTGGGVVSVIAHGEHGVFSIAYAVASPARPLVDTDFVPYQGMVNIPDHIPTPQTCADMGSSDALSGTFMVRFDASSTVRTSPSAPSPIAGPIWGSVYRASDVTITGPNDGAMPVANFHFTGVDVTTGVTTMEYTIDGSLPGGQQYQILGFMDTDGNADPMSPGPDVGDPVMIPIGGFPMQCAQQHITAEFALLLPAGV
jgi:hypothetical protein